MWEKYKCASVLRSACHLRSPPAPPSPLCERETQISGELKMTRLYLTHQLGTPLGYIPGLSTILEVGEIQPGHFEFPRNLGRARARARFKARFILYSTGSLRVDHTLES